MPRHVDGAGRAAEGLGGVAVAVEVERVGLRAAPCSAGRGRGRRCPGSTSFDRLPNAAPLRMVVEMLIHTCWLTPRLPLPAFQRQRSSVRPVPAKFGIWSKTWGAGRPVPWSSKVQETKVRSTGSRSVATRSRAGSGSLDRASLRTRSRQATVWPGLNGPPPERFVLGRVELHERAAEHEVLGRSLRVTLVGPGRVDGGQSRRSSEWCRRSRPDRRRCPG